MAAAAALPIAGRLAGLLVRGAQAIPKGGLGTAARQAATVTAKQLRDPATQELMLRSIPEAVVGGIGTTLETGNPLAGAVTGITGVAAGAAAGKAAGRVPGVGQNPILQDLAIAGGVGVAQAAVPGIIGARKPQTTGAPSEIERALIDQQTQLQIARMQAQGGLMQEALRQEPGAVRFLSQLPQYQGFNPAGMPAGTI
jgi:hypothetical protein